eukprot:3248231-Karenia_brevis.AAC.1
MALPPCELSREKRQQFAQTYVINLVSGNNTGSVHTWVKGRLSDGAGAGALVHVRPSGIQSDDVSSDDICPEFYITLTDSAAHRIEGRVRALEAAVEQLPGSPQ